jgi:hypothetical protein
VLSGAAIDAEGFIEPTGIPDTNIIIRALDGGDQKAIHRKQTQRRR